MVKFSPILYSTPMVQGILEDRKNQTRRTKGFELINKNPDDWEFWRFFEGYAKFVQIGNNINEKFIKSPYGKVGDVLWVRETFCLPNFHDGFEDDFYYKADNIKISDSRHKHFIEKWTPSLFMPKKAGRIFLEITNIRVEPLHDISESDAKSEGIKGRVTAIEPYDYIFQIPQMPNYFSTAKEAFKILWQSINGLDSWSKNPFVWVIELKRIQGFPTDYKLVGNQTEQKKFIGNAVEVRQAKALAKCCYYSLLDYINKQAA